MQEVAAPPADGRYLTIIQVGDYVNLLRQADGGGCLAGLSEADIVAISERRSCLVLDLCNEGPSLAPHIFDDLHAQLAERSIDRSAVLFVSQNRRIQQQYRKAYGAGISFAALDFFPLAIASWFDAARGPAVFPGASFDPGGYVPLSDLDGPVFLCQNAAVRWHRALLYRWLTLTGLRDDGLVSFHGVSVDNPKGREIDIGSPPPEIAEAFPDLLAGIAEWMPQRPERVDGDKRYGNDLVLTVDVAAFARTRLSIVTETDFFHGDVERITEKALKVASMGHPLLMVGAPRTLAFLRELGFTTFDGVIDQSYDAVEDPVDRLNAAFASIRRAHSLAKAEPGRWRRLVIDESLANYSHARSGLQRRLGQLVAFPLVARLEAFLHSGVIDPS